MSIYGKEFVRDNAAGSIAAARAIVPLVLRQYPHIKSVTDLGCGPGWWLWMFRAYGITNVTGVEGVGTDSSLYVNPLSQFYVADLNLWKWPFIGLDDLVMSVEVAEHLPESQADAFVDLHVSISNLVLFSAAHKGQTGPGHVNEQDLPYWEDKFKARGYRMLDFIRPTIAGVQSVPWWYRSNIVMFEKE